MTMNIGLIAVDSNYPNLAQLDTSVVDKANRKIINQVI